MAKFKLKDPRTSFEDLETGFKVSPGKAVELDPEKKKGTLTLRMIKSGGLIEVNRESDAEAAEGESGSGAKQKNKRRR